MNLVFIEAKNNNTSEYNFIKTVLTNFFADKNIEFVCMNGVDNLFNQTIVNRIRQAQDENNKVLVLVDADWPSKGWGYAKRHNCVENKMAELQIRFPFFIYPNNSDDGDVEVLMETLVCKDLYKDWWDCFEDYEKCVQGATDSEKKQKYNLPNRKAKLHTFISSQQLSNKQRDKIGRGFWLFDDPNYWDFTREELKPLLDFFKEHLQ